MRLIGRERERSAARAFATDGAARAGVLVLGGAAGLGKTALWQAVIGDARAAGVRVLAAAPGELEAGLSFVVLGDLVRDLAAEWREGMSAPQRRALEVALLLAEPSDEPPDPQAVGLATLEALRRLAAGGPLLLAVDDDQWTDPASARALAFALRRIGPAAVRVLAARRPQAEEGLVAALGDFSAVERIELGPLSPGALQALVQDRLGVVLARPVLRRVHQTSAGHPLHALELARALGGTHPRLALGAPLPVPGTLDGLVGERIGGLPAATRGALELAALAVAPTVALLAAAGVDDPGAAVGPAVAAELLVQEDGALRFAHPLYAAAIDRRLSRDARRTAHRALAGAMADVEEHARHLGLAADAPDGPVAAILEAAAAHAAGRGAVDLAVDLLERAIALTPETATDDLVRRRLAASTASHRAADNARGREHAQAALRLIPAGPGRAEALLRFATSSVVDTVAACEQALQEAGEDGALRARIRLMLSDRRLLVDFRAAGVDARKAAKDARVAGDDALLAQTLTMVGFLAVALGEADGHEHLVEAEAIERRLGGLPVEFSPAMNVAIEAMWRDDLDAARAAFRHQLRRAADAGDETGRVFVLLHLAQTEWRAGRLADADALLEQLLTAWAAAGEDQVLGIMLWLRSVIAGHRGRLDEAREAAEAALAANSDDALFGARQRAALGYVRLEAGDAQGAVEALEAAAAGLEGLGVREPGIVLFAGDLVEALVAAGRAGDAAAHVDALEALAARLDRPRLHCVAARGRGLLAAAGGDLDGAIAAYGQAAAQDGAPDLERARALLALGAAQRRAKRRGDARRSLQAAADLFTRLGADGFAARAREELGRIAGRATGAHGLTVAEARIAELVATGRSNREVASELFVSPRTVEGALTRVYAKLGVRSRAELVARFPRGDA